MAFDPRNPGDKFLNKLEKVFLAMEPFEIQEFVTEDGCVHGALLSMELWNEIAGRFKVPSPYDDIPPAAESLQNAGTSKDEELSYAKSGGADAVRDFLVKKAVDIAAGDFKVEDEEKPEMTETTPDPSWYEMTQATEAFEGVYNEAVAESQRKDEGWSRPDMQRRISNQRKELKLMRTQLDKAKDLAKEWGEHAHYWMDQCLEADRRIASMKRADFENGSRLGLAEY